MKMIIENKKRAFSLVEVMMTLLILSIVMVLMAPVITKKVTMRKTEGIVYTYKNADMQNPNKCFALNAAGDTLYSTTNCSEYTFTPPQGVTTVNLTLVAGGGGGGGAAGGKLETKLGTSTVSYLTDKIQNVTINYLTAKGQTGGNANSNCASTDSICAGNGGMSSSAILNFSIPDSLFRTKPDIIYNANAKNNITLSVNNAEATKSAEISLPNITYRVKGPVSSTDAGTIECTTGGATYKASEGGFSQCLLPSQNILASKKGDAGFYLRKASYSSAYVGKVLQGGMGGLLNTAGAYSSYGTGGKGASYSITSCNASTCTGTSGTPQAGSNGYASVSYTLEHAGGIGGGGAGGSAVKILAFPVDSSKEYIVRVGKGGRGGAGGVTGENATPGVSGEAGTTTSIWEKTDSGETLLFMVVGGAPGYGGNVASSTSSEKGNPGPSGRNYPTFIYATSMQNFALDEHISRKVAGSSAIAVPTSISGASSIRISYPYLTDSTNNANQPYKTLNDNSVGNNATNNDNKTGGYNAFNTGSIKYIQVAQLNTTTKENAYDGFYYRTVIGDKVGYPGGLGGFSGLGTKAGCGGLFMGNADGRTQKSVTKPDNTVTNTNENNNTYINKLLIPATTGTAYEVNNYYGNCSLSTPNGQTAKFILPDASTSALGQAGSGGGGGGYVMFQTPGKGGDGQNGYLMINWRR